ncbi:Alkaline phosphatase synthesis sensor protein PhoR [Enhygromyxa salina]|uniref:histidine kinase n=1 Tax=Enhygromyxa salina TaxID=215803 RepID=A0A2S9XY76_9BACT|nr:ATP-binding protein [Enhygromyxa salina]PRP97700.1 Alkaline phosphatase synthesis sensor protein PhoR [Enhygromyxa salina]
MTSSSGEQARVGGEPDRDPVTIGAPERADGAAPKRADEDAPKRAHGPTDELLEAMPNRAALIDRDGRVVAANRAWLSPTANEQPDAPAWRPIGSHYLAGLTPGGPTDEIGAFVAGVLEVLDGRRRRYESEVPRDGPRGRTWFLIQVSAVDRAERLALITEEDVSTRRRAQEALVASENRLRTIITGAPIVLFSIDPDGILSLFDGLGAAGLGVSPERVIGRSVFEVFAHVPQLLGAVRKAMTGETTLTTAPIGRLTFELRCSPAVTSDDRLEGVVGIATDITERARIERLKNEFVSIVSHELRTPLTSIRGSLGLLDGGVVGELEARTSSLVKIALSNTERLIRLVNDILDLDKIETGKLELRNEFLDPVALANEAIAEISGYAEECGVTLVREFEPASELRGDRDRLLQVLINLLSNAIKFSKSGDTVYVELDEVATGTVRFSIRDEGPGIPEDQLPKLFRKFSQLDESDTRSAGGSGLGLAISKAIVDAHGGVIGVESQPGVGSRFHFEIGETERERPLRRFRAESSPFRKARRARVEGQRSNPVLELVDGAVVLIGSSGGDHDRDLARELHRQATSLARRRGLPVPVRSSLIRVASALSNFVTSSGAAEDREQRQALAEALRTLEDEAQRAF